MTDLQEQIRAAVDQHSTVAPPLPTATDLVGAARHRVRRQRIAIGVAAAASVSAVALGATFMLAPSSKQSPPAHRPTPAPGPTHVTVVPNQVHAKRTVLVDKPWGSAAGAFGFEPGNESSSSAPTALAVSGAGQLAVIDKVNARVLFFDEQG